MDRAEFSERVWECRARMYRVALSILGRGADAEDAVQTALLNAWRAVGKMRDEQYFETWLMRIVINTCRSELRARKRRPAFDDETAMDVPQPPPPDLGLFLALEKLDEKYRTPLMLHCAEGYDAHEVADMLRLPVGAVKWRIHQGREKLEKLLDEEAADV